MKQWMFCALGIVMLMTPVQGQPFPDCIERQIQYEATMRAKEKQLNDNKIILPPESNPQKISEHSVIGTVDLGPYMARLQQRVKRLWFNNSERNKSCLTILAFTINRNGELSQLRVQRSSGDAVSDEAAKEAIRRASPFAPLPAAYRQQSIDVIFTFDVSRFGTNYDGQP